MKKLLVSDVSDTIYLANAKQCKADPSLWEMTGDKQDFTKDAISAVFQWFMQHMSEFKDGERVENEEYSVTYKEQPFILKMIRKEENNG